MTLPSPVGALSLIAIIASCVSGCEQPNAAPPVIQLTAPAPPAVAPQPLIYDAYVGKPACASIQLDHGIPTGIICGTLAEARPDGIVLAAVEKNAYNIEPGLTVALPTSIVRYVMVRP